MLRLPSFVTLVMCRPATTRLAMRSRPPVGAARPMVMIVDGPRRSRRRHGARAQLLTTAHCVAANAGYDAKVSQQEEGSTAWGCTTRANIGERTIMPAPNSKSFPPESLSGADHDLGVGTFSLTSPRYIPRFVTVRWANRNGAFMQILGSKSPSNPRPPFHGVVERPAVDRSSAVCRSSNGPPSRRQSLYSVFAPTFRVSLQNSSAERSVNRTGRKTGNGDPPLVLETHVTLYLFRKFLYSR